MLSEHYSTVYCLPLSCFNIDSDTFFSWLTQDLLPKVPKNSVIVMDNAAFHKREDILNCINVRW